MHAESFRAITSRSLPWLLIKLCWRSSVLCSAFVKSDQSSWKQIDFHLNGALWEDLCFCLWRVLAEDTWCPWFPGTHKTHLHARGFLSTKRCCLPRTFERSLVQLKVLEYTCQDTLGHKTGKTERGTLQETMVEFPPTSSSPEPFCCDVGKGNTEV